VGWKEERVIEMADKAHLAILRQGVAVWNRWREEHPEIVPDLSEGDLNPGDVSGTALELEAGSIRFLGANLSGVDLSGTNLMSADLTQARLVKANLEGASLSGARLTHAILTGANLRRANLLNADLRQAILIETDFSRAIMGRITFGENDLSEARGLETVEHYGGSLIDIGTLYLSKGQIPEAFLLRAGVTGEFIKAVAPLVVQEYYSCFLSHSSKDKRFCDRLYADLQAKRVRVFYFPEDATWGRSVWDEIDRNIQDRDKLVVVCSKDSLQSRPVLREIERALQREDREHKNILFPVQIDDYLFDEWEHPRKDDVLGKVVGDFRGWDTDAARYEIALQRLLKALNTKD